VWENYYNINIMVTWELLPESIGILLYYHGVQEKLPQSSGREYQKDIEVFLY
jgi:hypothetical protein